MKGLQAMTYQTWFDSMDIRHDIEEVHSLYNTVKDHSSDWGYDVKKSPQSFEVSRYNIEPHRFTAKTAMAFCEYLDSLYDLGVDGEYIRVTAR